jgi:hypothetical protein
MVNNERIAIVKQKTSYLEKQDIEAYLAKVSVIANRTRASIIVGPELSLSSPVNMLSLSHLEKKISDFSKCFKGRLILPGTGIVKDDENKSMYNIAPIIFRDGSVSYIHKNSSHVEDLIAESNGLNYKRGDVEKEILFDKGKNGNFAVEICRDHGIGKLKNISKPNLKFQFVLANNLSGLFPEKVLVENGGIAVLAEGRKPEDSWAYFKRNRDLIPLKGSETEDYILFN